MDINQIYQGDCLEIMKKIDDKSIDMICCDLPYGTTNCKWDTIIPFEALWTEYKRITKDNAAIVLNAAQPFTSALIMSNPDMFKYEWIWHKSKITGFLNANKQPMRNHEQICVFYSKQCTYNPQKTTGHKKLVNNFIDNKQFNSNVYNKIIIRHKFDSTERYPTSIQKFKSLGNIKDRHPTQKPLELIEYLIKTYTNEGDLVLDNCIGSGTTAIAAINTKRNFIGIEKDEEYFKIAEQRINNGH